MRVRKSTTFGYCTGFIEAHKAGLKSIKRDELEAHFLAGGHVTSVVHALVSAAKANIDLTFQMLRLSILPVGMCLKLFKCR